jgi:hypothetical protein
MLLLLLLLSAALGHFLLASWAKKEQATAASP